MKAEYRVVKVSKEFREAYDKPYNLPKEYIEYGKYDLLISFKDGAKALFTILSSEPELDEVNGEVIPAMQFSELRMYDCEGNFLDTFFIGQEDIVNLYSFIDYKHNTEYKLQIRGDGSNMVRLQDNAIVVNLKDANKKFVVVLLSDVDDESSVISMHEVNFEDIPKDVIDEAVNEEYIVDKYYKESIVEYYAIYYTQGEKCFDGDSKTLYKLMDKFAKTTKAFDTCNEIGEQLCKLTSTTKSPKDIFTEEESKSNSIKLNERLYKIREYGNFSDNYVYRIIERTDDNNPSVEVETIRVLKNGEFDCGSFSFQDDLDPSEDIFVTTKCSALDYAKSFIEKIKLNISNKE